jgi:hypothetical protein
MAGREPLTRFRGRNRKELTPRDRPGLEAAAAGAEAALEAILKDDSLAAIPVVSTAIQFLKGVDSIRDRMFAAKVVAFVKSIEDMTPDERDAAARKLAGSDDGRRVGETLLFVLEQLTDLDKPELLAFLFKEFAAGRMTGTEFRRLAVAVNAAFPDDLFDFLDEALPAPMPTTLPPHRERLVAAGLTRIVAGDTIDALGQTSYQRTEVGQLLWRLVRLSEGKPVGPIAGDW